MKTMNWKKALLMALCVVLIAAAALFAAGHFGKQEDPRTPNEALAVAIPVADGAAVGQGERAFTFAIVDKAGAQTTVAVSTDKTTVGDALVELGLIEGEDHIIPFSADKNTNRLELIKDIENALGE